MNPCPSNATLSSRIVTECRLLNAEEASSQRFALASLRVPAEWLARLQRFEREQTRERRVVADFHVGVRLLPRLHTVEEVLRVDVERVVLFDAAVRVHVHLGFDRFLVAA